MDCKKTFDDQQLIAVEHEAGPALLLAGAGTGKTRTLVQRFVRLWQKRIVWPYDICVLTFSTTAADEFRQRVQLAAGSDIAKVEKLAIRTFHAHCRQILFDHEFRTHAKPPRVFPPEQAFRVLRQSMADVLQGRECAWSPREVIEIISDAKEVGATPSAFVDTASASQVLIGRLYQRYQTLMEAEHAFDFADLIGRTIALLETDTRLLGLLHERHPFLMVDEGQDTSLRQFHLLRLLAGPSANVMVSAAPAQEIYRWRQTNYPALSQQFFAAWPHAQTITLRTNYRSSGHIVRASASLLAQHHYPDTSLFPTRQDGDPVRVICVATEHDEATFVVREVRQLTARKVPYNQMAVLARTSAQLTPVERELSAFRIPGDLVGHEGLYDRPAAMHCLAYLALVALPPEQSERYLETVINVPPRGIGPITLKDLKAGDSRLRWVHLRKAMSVGSNAKVRPAALEGLRALHKTVVSFQPKATQLGPAKLIGSVLECTGYYRYLSEQLDVETQLGTIRAVQSEAQQYSTAAEFLAALREQRWENSAFLPGEGVQLCTIHAVKGRQYQAVWMIGCEEGLLPHVKAQCPEQEEGERRLFYVGMTRAIRWLTLLCTETRSINNRLMRSRPSRYLRDLPAAHVVRHLA